MSYVACARPHSHYRNNHIIYGSRDIHLEDLFIFVETLWLIRSSRSDAHTEMMQYPHLVLNDVSGLTLTEEMENCLIALADETMGPEGNAKNTSGQYL